MELRFELYAEDPAEAPIHSDPFSDVALRAGDVLSDDQLNVDDQLREVVKGKNVQKLGISYGNVESFNRTGSVDGLPGADWELNFNDGNKIEINSAVLLSGTVD